jgi:hypothetical protein
MEKMSWKKRKQAILADLLQTEASWLGFTEPTLCSRAGVRLHETSPEDSETVSLRTSNDLLLHEAEYVKSQHTLGLPALSGKLALPRLVQYDLAHLTEGLPETRKKAASDHQHSFLKRQQAEQSLLDHLRAYHTHRVVPCLVWHAFHPAHGEKSIYEMPGVDPFAATKTPEERELLKALAENLHLPPGEWSSALSTDQRLVLKTMQAKLDRIAAFAKALGENSIVAIFRPYHEANGHWFWWSVDRFANDKEDSAALFWQLWQHTRQYLEEVCGVHNLLYAWSPNIDGAWFAEGVDVVKHYTHGIEPETIDIMGVDCYSNNLRFGEEDLLSQRREVLLKGLEVIATLQRHFPDKPVGFTELGLRYHEVLKQDEGEATLGQSERGGGTFNVPFFRRFSRWAKHAPHFTIFWRNEPHSLEFPIAGLSPEMDEEVRGIYEHFSTVGVRV